MEGDGRWEREDRGWREEGQDGVDLGGGVLSFLDSLLRFLTTLEWMAQETQ